LAELIEGKSTDAAVHRLDVDSIHEKHQSSQLLRDNLVAAYTLESQR